MAIAGILVALLAGLRGLAQDPVKGTDASGVTILSGTFEPFGCGRGCAEGYIQAGARSVFVIFPRSCADPLSGSSVTVRGRLDRSQGNATYRATSCV